MTKLFKDVNVNDKLYFLADGKIIESNVENVYVNDNKIVFDNKRFPFYIEPVTLFKTSCKSGNTYIYTSKEEAISAKKVMFKEVEDEKKSKYLYTKEELENMNFSEYRDAVSNMSSEEALYHFGELIGSIFGIDDPIISVNSNDSESEEDDKCECEADEVKEDKNPPIKMDVSNFKKKEEKPSYHVPSYDEIREMEKSTNLNENGGLKSIPAILVISINKDGIETLDSEHFKNVNPVFDGPNLYFHKVLIPDFDQNASDNDVDEVYKATEDWIYKNYPELEMLEYDAEWRYDFLRGNDYFVNTENTINLNIFE